jgi:hypothetical protein
MYGALLINNKVVYEVSGAEDEVAKRIGGYLYFEMVKRYSSGTFLPSQYNNFRTVSELLIGVTRWSDLEAAIYVLDPDVLEVMGMGRPCLRKA